MKIFDWQEYYLLARVLLSQADSSPHKEAMLRSAVSRAIMQLSIGLVSILKK